MSASYDSEAHRPLSYYSHHDDEHDDPWAIPDDATQQTYTQPQSESSSTAHSRQSSTASNATQTQAQLTEQHRQEQPQVVEPMPPSSPRAVAPLPSSTSSLDAWSRPQQSSGATKAPLSGLPTSTSTFRGGFTDRQTNNHNAAAASSSSASNAATSSSMPALAGSGTRATGPWKGQQLTVLLRPELEGLLVLHHTYTILRKPRQTTSGTHGMPRSTTTLLTEGRAAQKHSQSSSSKSHPSSSKSNQRSQAALGDHLPPFGPGWTTVRRYSDFVYLHETLLKRYPFRLVPPLPPKRLALPPTVVSLGGPSAQDDAFVEQRRRGLQRFLHGVINHPTLSYDEVVKAFLEDKGSFSDWRSAHPNVDMTEEALRSQQSGSSSTPPSSSASAVIVPKDLDAKLDAVNKLAPSMLEWWTQLVHLYSTQARRFEASAGDWQQIAAITASIGQSVESKPRQQQQQQQQQHNDTGSGERSSERSRSGRSAGPTSPQPEPSQLTQHLSSYQSDLQSLSSLRSSWTQLHLIEFLKEQRDLWTSWQSMATRRAKLAREEDIATLKAKVADTRGRLGVLNSVPIHARGGGGSNNGSGSTSGSGNNSSSNANSHGAEQERLETQLKEDWIRLEVLTRRRDRIRIALWQEWGLLQKRKRKGAMATGPGTPSTATQANGHSTKQAGLASDDDDDDDEYDDDDNDDGMEINDGRTLPSGAHGNASGNGGWMTWLRDQRMATDVERRALDECMAAIYRPAARMG
ncbi:unnamed protein product [Jaminaea pallidilutea]